MNRPQLPVEIKAVICERILAGEWTPEAAATATSYTTQSIGRWLERYEKGGAEALKIKRGRGTRPNPKRLSKAVRQVVDTVLDSQPHMRTRSLQDYLRRHHQMKVARRVLDRYLKSRGLAAVRPPTADEAPPRRFEAPEPLAMVQVDLMYVPKTGGGHLFVANVLDDHSRFLLASRALEVQTGQAVLAVFRNAVERWGTPQAVLTDRGTQFVHWRGRTRFQDYVEKELDARHILAATQHPQTIGKVERFHATLRKEKLRKVKDGYPTIAVLQTDLDGYADYYNYERPHQGLDGLTPADRFYNMGKPTAAALGLAQASNGAAAERVFLTANLMGKRLVLAGPNADSLRVLWSEDRATEPGGERSIW